MKTRQAAKIAANGVKLSIVQRYELAPENANGLHLENGTLVTFVEFVLYRHTCEYNSNSRRFENHKKQIGKYPSMWQAMNAAANEF